MLGLLPALADRPRSNYLADAAGTRLQAAIDPAARRNPGKSGIVLLRHGSDALAARVMLADAAERSLDMQYYIWRYDVSGALLFNAVRRAADRGVRVRLLLDDNNTSGLDALLALLDDHPNIEVRLFNPFIVRRVRWLSYLRDFSRLNRRMHNKTFTADNQATIIGGRNIGDEYFGVHEQVSFVDLDVLAIGAVVGEVSQSFDAYWSCDSSHCADRIVRPLSRREAAKVAAGPRTFLSQPAANELREEVAESRLVPDLLAGTLDVEWSSVRMLVDDPRKGLARERLRDTLSDRLSAALGKPKRRLYLVSPYLVPTRTGMQTLIGLAQRGIDVQILTNSLEATDVATVHAGYVKRRRRLVKAGVVLYELKRTAPPTPRRLRRRQRDRRLSGSSGSSLHAKTFAVDGERVFVGSFNFDPRSARLNTEIGFLIESPAFAGGLEEWFTQQVPRRSYRVALDALRRLRWLELRDDGNLVHASEPGAQPLRRWYVRLVALLPIDWLL